MSGSGGRASATCTVKQCVVSVSAGEKVAESGKASAQAEATAAAESPWTGGGGHSAYGRGPW